ncbi:hypothetical protein [Campylobacter hyointestinalis]|nr:hypothetical protein [Campylobacter hyointestinalis]
MAILALNFTLIAELKTTSGESMNSKIFATVSLLHFKTAVEIKPKNIHI